MLGTNRLKACASAAMLVSIVAMATAPLDGQQPLQILDLGPNTFPSAVNTAGQIVGMRIAPDLDSPFVYDLRSGSVSEIPTLGGFAGGANDINDDGITVGRSQVAPGDVHAFLHIAATGTLIDLHTAVTLGGSNSSAVGINNLGHVVGWAESASGFPRAFWFDTSTRRRIDLGTLGGHESVAWDLNDQGLVVGTSTTTDGKAHAVLWRCTASACALQDLGTLGGANSAAYGVSDAGNIWGASEVPGGSAYHAFVTTTLRPLATSDDIGVLAGCDSIFSGGIANVAVGQSDSGGQSVSAVRYSVEGRLEDLNAQIDGSSGWHLHDATAINARGVIVGIGARGDVPHGFALVPIDLATGGILVRRREIAVSPAGRNHGTISAQPAADQSCDRASSVPAEAIAQLRMRVDALRMSTRLSAFSWSDSVSASSSITVGHLAEVRSALLPVYGALGLSAPLFSHFTILRRSPSLSVAEIEEVSNAIAALQTGQRNPPPKKTGRSLETYQ